MTKDKIFAKKGRLAKDFDFGAETASVFDDMLTRSVPFYVEMQRMIGELSGDFAVPGTNIYDLGCSTATTLVALDKMIPEGVRYVGVDYSPEMLKKAKDKLIKHGIKRPYDLQQGDLNESVPINNASMVIMNLTLQFIRPLYRQRLITEISRGLNSNGCLILIEKVLCKDSLLNRLYIDHYYEFKKRNGYSKLEISQKREALENVLVPFRVSENMELLLSHGFADCEIFFKWYNFCGFIARKA